MGKPDQVGGKNQWITLLGDRIFIFSGETLRLNGEFCEFPRFLTTKTKPSNIPLLLVKALSQLGQLEISRWMLEVAAQQGGYLAELLGKGVATGDKDGFMCLECWG